LEFHFVGVHKAFYGNVQVTLLLRNVPNLRLR
jgi:hypothetical protein